ncbi:MAG: PIN domain-containing protein [Desulfobacterota bacterium]|nr:PIN domain-containing protein [Thermodesulfobacteriota bacterium]
MKRLFVDTGAWYALVDKKDPDHARAVSFFRNNQTPLLTTNFIFDETVTLLRRRLGWTTTAEFGRRLQDSRFVTLLAVRREDEDKAWELFLQFKDQDFSYTDCTSFTVMAALRIKAAFSFDTHFKTMHFQVFPLSTE